MKVVHVDKRPAFNGDWYACEVKSARRTYDVLVTPKGTIDRVHVEIPNMAVGWRGWDVTRWRKDRPRGLVPVVLKAIRQEKRAMLETPH